jgi:hypothetical protein
MKPGIKKFPRPNLKNRLINQKQPHSSRKSTIMLSRSLRSSVAVNALRNGAAAKSAPYSSSKAAQGMFHKSLVLTYTHQLCALKQRCTTWLLWAEVLEATLLPSRQLSSE